MAKATISLQIFLFALSWIFAFPAFAQKAAVVPAQFVYADTDPDSQDESLRSACEKLTQQATLGALDAGWEVAPVDELRRGLRAISGNDNGACRETSCLGELAQHMGVDEVIFVRVTEYAELDREIEILFGVAPPLKERSDDGFMVMLEEVRRMVVLGLQKSLSLGRGHPRASASAKEGPGDEVASRDAAPDGPTEPMPALRGRHAVRLNPVAFYISTGLAVASGIVWGVLDANVYARYRKLDEGTRSREYWQTTRTLQVTEWTMVGVTGIAAAAALTLFFFTDFKGDSEKRAAELRPLRISAVALEDGGVIVFGHRF